jgi:hypothetical protein
MGRPIQAIYRINDSLLDLTASQIKDGGGSRRETGIILGGYSGRSFLRREQRDVTLA